MLIKRLTKFYVALSDGLHGVIDDGNTVAGNLNRSDVILELSEGDLKKIQLTTNDGELDCAYDANGDYSCTAVNPIRKISGLCVDNDTPISLTGRIEMLGNNFSTDDWGTIVSALKGGNHPYQIGDTKTINMGSFGNHKIRIANLSTPSECNNPEFSQTACGVVLEFEDIVTQHPMNDTDTNLGGWPASKMRTFLNNDIYNALPSELRNGIINTVSISGYGKKDSSNFIVMDDKVYLLSAKEVWGENFGLDFSSYATRQLDYYRIKGVTSSNHGGAIKNRNIWWLRSAHSNTEGSFYSSAEDGDYGYYFRAGANFGVSPAFRLA